MGSHLCRPAGPKCYAPEWSLGEICVGCNCCGRLNPDRVKILRARAAFLREGLRGRKHFKYWSDDPEGYAIQKKNIAADIRYFTRKLAQVRKQLTAELSRRKRSRR